MLDQRDEELLKTAKFELVAHVNTDGGDFFWDCGCHCAYLSKVILK